MQQQLNYYAGLYQAQCSNFVENDHVQWPTSSRNGVEDAQKVFSLQWDLLRIIQNWGETESLLPNEYQYELYSHLMALCILLIIMSICICLCCCQVFCIPKYQVYTRCCYVQVDRDTQSQGEKYCLSFSLLIFGVLLIVICGLSYGDEHIENSLLQIKCISLWMIETTIEKNALHAWQPNWGGVQEIDRNIKIFNNTLQQSHVSLMKLNSLPNIDDKVGKEQLLKLYDEHKGDLLTNPDPFIKGGILCDYIANLGPYTKIGSTSQLMYDELAVRDQALLLFQGIQNTSQYIDQNIEQISNKLNVTKIQLYDFTKKIIQFLSKIDDSINKQSWMINWGISVYKNYLVVIGITLILLFISFILVTWFKIQKLAFLLHISWISITILLLLGLGVLALVYYIGLIDNNMVCVLADNITNNPEILKKIIHLEGHHSHLYQNKTFIEEIQVCLYHKGDLVKYLHLENQFTQIELLNQYTTQVSEMVLSQDVLQEQIKIISSYQKNYGLILPNANDVLTEFNRYTDSGLDNSYQIDCQVSKDEWEWKSDECLYYYGRSEFGMAVCLLFDDFDEQQVNKRYEKKFKKCNEANKNKDIEETIFQYYHSLYRYIKSVNSTFIPIMENLEEYQNSLNILDKQIGINVQNISFYASQLKELFFQQEQLRISMDCSYMKEGAIRFKNTFCTTLLNGLFILYLYLIAICILLSIISIISVWSAMRCIPDSTQYKIFTDAISVNLNDRFDSIRRQIDQN